MHWEDLEARLGDDVFSFSEQQLGIDHAHAIGGMSAFIPNRAKPDVTARAVQQVADDKRREAGDGFDGTWVAHPGLVETARAEFDAVFGDRPNQVDRLRDDVQVEASDLLDLRIDGEVTDAGVRSNVSIAVRSTESSRATRTSCSPSPSTGHLPAAKLASLRDRLLRRGRSHMVNATF